MPKFKFLSGKIKTKIKSKKLDKSTNKATTKVEAQTPARPSGVIVSIRPVVEYVVDVHRYSDGRKYEKPTWSSWVRKGTFTSPQFAQEAASHIMLEEGKNCDDVQLEDFAHKVTIEEIRLAETLYTKHMKEKEDAADKKSVEKNRKSFIPVTINKAKDMLKARKKLRKSIGKNK